MKYLISRKSITEIIMFGSSHPKRKNYLAQTYSFMSPFRLPYHLHLGYANLPRCLNLFIGDSHAEFCTRLFNTSTCSSSRSLPVAFHTGPTTLYGALMSKSYFVDVAHSVLLIKQALHPILPFNRVNVLLSLGEIDLRTKIYLTCLTSLGNTFSHSSINLLLHRHYSGHLYYKLSAFKAQIKELLGASFGRISIVMPPPPSSSFPFQTPESYQQALETIELVQYPRFGDYSMRLYLWNALNNVVLEICNRLDIGFMANLLYDSTADLIHAWTDDGCHVSKGLAFECNSYMASNLT